MQIDSKFESLGAKSLLEISEAANGWIVTVYKPMKLEEDPSYWDQKASAAMNYPLAVAAAKTAQAGENSDEDWKGESGAVPEKMSQEIDALTKGMGDRPDNITMGGIPSYMGGMGGSTRALKVEAYLFIDREKLMEFISGLIT